MYSIIRTVVSEDYWVGAEITESGSHFAISQHSCHLRGFLISHVAVPAPVCLAIVSESVMSIALGLVVEAGAASLLLARYNHIKLIYT